MPVSKDFNKLRGFEEHGVRFVDKNETQAIGFCPFCGLPKKFYANLTSKLWDCKSCGRSGNFPQFLGKRLVQYQKDFIGKVASRLSLNRKLRPQTLSAWGFGWTGAFYVLPTTGNIVGKLTDLRRYTLGGRLMSTSGAHPSFVVPLKQHESDRVWLCEGEWDAMALWEVIQKMKLKDNVCAAPGSTFLPVKLAEMFYDKEVCVVYDNDDAGRRGMKKVHTRLATVARSLQFIHWPDGTEDKADVRDFYLSQKREAVDTYSGLVSFLEDNPPTDASQASVDVDKEEEIEEGVGLEPEVVETRFKKWLYMASTEPLDVIYGAVYANRIDGDPLWLFLVAPSGGSKSALLSTFSRFPARAYCLTSLTPKTLVSGAIGRGGKDPSLIPTLNGKILVIKDFTVILNMGTDDRNAIFSTLRDAYDGEYAKPFGTGEVRRFESTFGILAGVTPAIESVHGTNSPLGERFLKYRIRYGGNIETGREAIQRSLQNIGKHTAMSMDLRAVTHAMLGRKIEPDDWPEMPGYMQGKIIHLAQWVAKLRGAVSREKYTGRIQHKPHTEIGTRLAKQLAKLCLGISIYKREKVVSDKTYRTIVSVAQDTAPDTVEEIVRQLYIRDHDLFYMRGEIARWCKFPSETVHYILEDMVLLGICEPSKEKRGTYRLDPKMVKIMRGLRLYWRERSWYRGKQNIQEKKQRRRIR